MKKTVLYRGSIAAAAACACVLLWTANAEARSGSDSSSRSTQTTLVAGANGSTVMAAWDVMRTLNASSLGLQTDTPAPPSDSKTDVTVTTTTTHWYASPIWIAIGVLAAGFMIVLIALAVRGSGNQGSTTIVHD